MNALRTAFSESKVEARIARLESDVQHVCADTGEIKADVRDLRAKLDALRDAFNAKIGSLRDSLTKAMIWALVLYIALAATLLGVLARGFHWL
jgi:hypothetical protein